MIVQALFYLIVALTGIYYLTVALDLVGVNIFSNRNIDLAKAMIPFYYWLKSVDKKESVSFKEKIKDAEEAVTKAKDALESLNTEADQESERAKDDLALAKRTYTDSKKNLDILKKTKF